jgi:hypothetical protein
MRGGTYPARDARDAGSPEARQPVEAGSGGGCPVRRRSPLGLDRSTWIPGSSARVSS